MKKSQHTNYNYSWLFTPTLLISCSQLLLPLASCEFVLRRQSTCSMANLPESLRMWAAWVASAWLRLQMVIAGNGSFVIYVGSGLMPTITGVVFHFSKASCMRNAAKQSTANRASPKKTLQWIRLVYSTLPSSSPSTAFLTCLPCAGGDC